MSTRARIAVALVTTSVRFTEPPAATLTGATVAVDVKLGAAAGAAIAVLVCGPVVIAAMRIAEATRASDSVLRRRPRAGRSPAPATRLATLRGIPFILFGPTGRGAKRECGEGLDWSRALTYAAGALRRTCTRP